MPLTTDEIIEIHTLYARYNHAIDNARHEEFASTFVEDGSLDAGLSQAAGRAELVEFSDVTQQMAPGIRHLVSNVLVEGDGDSASGSAYLVVHLPGDEGRKVILTGIYEDQLSRVDGQWLFATRKLLPDS